MKSTRSRIKVIGPNWKQSKCLSTGKCSEQEQTMETCYHVGEPQEYYAKWKKAKCKRLRITGFQLFEVSLKGKSKAAWWLLECG